MRRSRLLVSMLAVGVVAVTVAAAAPRGGWITVPGRPWTDILYGPDGTLESARGYAPNGIPLSLNLESDRVGDSLRTTVKYLRGKQSLRIDRSLDPRRGLIMSYRTEMESWTLSILPDETTGEALALYTLTGGRTFSFWIDAQGQVVNGDLEKLRKALKAPSVIGRLLRQYSRDRDRLGTLVPTVGEAAFFAMPQKTCEDSCAEGCSGQCAWECNFWGYFGCRICRISCALGCSIGC